MAAPWIPREHKFFEMFDEVAGIIVQAGKMFSDLVEQFDHRERRVNDLRELEHKCDMAVETILTTLARTFLTPFDREDIHSMATSMDDVLDNMEEAAYRLVAFRIERPTPEALKLALIIQQSCEYLQRAVQLLHGQLSSQEMSQCLREISRLENDADDVFRTAEASLFANPPEIMTFIKWKELYEWLESTVDACRDVAHVINEIVVKGS
jgi:hypothetical protein